MFARVMTLIQVCRVQDLSAVGREFDDIGDFEVAELTQKMFAVRHCFCFGRFPMRSASDQVIEVEGLPS